GESVSGSGVRAGGAGRFDHGADVGDGTGGGDADRRRAVESGNGAAIGAERRVVVVASGFDFGIFSRGPAPGKSRGGAGWAALFVRLGNGRAIDAADALQPGGSVYRGGGARRGEDCADRVVDVVFDGEDQCPANGEGGDFRVA